MADADLAFAGLAAQADAVRSGEVSSRELVELCLERIARLDPELNAFRVVLAGQALAAADAITKDDERPLAGVPVAIKDDTDLAGEVTGMGIDLFDPPATADANLVRRLREAGAIPIGKTHVPQLLAHPFTETPTFGATRNPWNLAHTPGGSSGGSAAAVAAGLVGGAQGSDGAGSIRVPAANTRLFGLKPTRGRISFAPDWDGWHGMAVTGPLVPTVRDAALFLDAAAGAEPGDPHSEKVPPPAEPFVEAAARAPGKLRVALSFKIPPGTITPVKEDCRRVTRETAELLRSLGHEVIERDPPYGPISLNATARVLGGIGDHARRYRPKLRIERRLRARARLARVLAPPPAIAHARRDEARLAARVNAIFDDVDVVLTPCQTAPPFAVGRYEGVGETRLLQGDTAVIAYMPPWNALGNPAMSVPAGFADGRLPLGVQVVGRFGDEATLFSLAAQIEAERPWRGERPPHS